MSFDPVYQGVLRTLAYKPECKPWCKVKQNDADFIKCHAGIVNGIEAILRYAEPVAMDPVDQVSGKDEQQGPEN